MTKKLAPEDKAQRAEARKAARKAAKRAAEIAAYKSQKPVKQLTISIEWCRSQHWGRNPHATAVVEFWDGTSIREDGFRCSGCGYDKESTVVSSIFNRFLSYKLWNLSPEDKHPYGMTVGEFRYYAHDVGMSCYYDIAKHIGGKLDKLAGVRHFDVYRYEDEPKILQALALAGGE